MRWQTPICAISGWCLRPELDEAGIHPTSRLPQLAHGTNVHVAGLVAHRRRRVLPVEDETGMANVLISPALFDRQRRIILDAAALTIFGRLERAGGATDIIAARLTPLRVVTGRDVRRGR
ncbi:hypothetical protein [Actinomadura rudentiformis]|uniref:OB domain-containing protein n=1 Tax=Actinomadura rudentiformis TaxID=359158 RepID=A0A6H9Z769_9ACTN|nr:hypothetical protein [Actinomadura rudentiformis]KAB2352186.1 hypothetical protein F8566_00240 [Actinomadura rudentiformis]